MVDLVEIENFNCVGIMCCSFFDIIINWQMNYSTIGCKSDLIMIIFIIIWLQWVPGGSLLIDLTNFIDASSIYTFFKLWINA